MARTTATAAAIIAKNTAAATERVTRDNHPPVQSPYLPNMDNRPMDWIVIAGQLIDTAKGGGFEFFGPFTKSEAEEVRQSMHDASSYNKDRVYMAVQLLGVYRRKFDRKKL